MDNRQLEVDILGTILTYSERFSGVRQYLREEFFKDPFLRRVYRVVEECEEQGIPVDPVNFSSVGKFTEHEIGRVYTELCNRGSQAELQTMIRKLAENHMSFLMNSILPAIKKQNQEGQDVRESLDRLQLLVESCEQIFQSFRVQNIKSDLHRYTEYLDKKANGRIDLVHIGFAYLNELLGGGLEMGDLVVIGGTPGSGKTSFMLNLALSMLKSKVRVAFLEAEMTREQIYVRMNAIHEGVTKSIVRSGKQQKEVNQPFIGWLYDQPFHLDICEERTPSELKRRIDYYATIKHCKVVFVDYLQVFRVRQTGVSEYDDVSRTASMLRQLALKHKVCIFAASSLNRIHFTKNEKPGLHSFRGSGEIEHYMATGMILWGEENDVEELSNPQRKLELLVVKGREHARGTINLDYDLATQRMTEKREEDSILTSEEREHQSS